MDRLKLKYDAGRGLFRLENDVGKCACVFSEKETIFDWLLREGYIAVRPEWVCEPLQYFVKVKV